MSSQTPADFIRALQAFPALPTVFNPWRDVDPVHDLGENQSLGRSICCSTSARGWGAHALFFARKRWLTNCRPTPQELGLGRPLLQQFLAMFPLARTVAVGQASEGVLAKLGVAVAGQVRHPANRQARFLFGCFGTSA